MAKTGEEQKEQRVNGTPDVRDPETGQEAGAETAQETAAADGKEPEAAEADGQETEQAAAAGESTGKKPIFGKKKEKAEKPDPLKEEIKELKDKCMRQMAEFENFRKRTDKEKAQMFDSGAAHAIEKILPVVDNFERGLAAIPEAEKGGAVAEGMEKIYRQLAKALEDLGVAPIEALGKEFDPNYHNAVMQTEATEEYPSGVVAQEMQKGYLYHDTVIRHSMVAVSE
ncbi:MAG: nucleotide exchange factor GrpE [Lachnospiraceae bacterium]|nr:nucleotide exchange factor GrpE [Lachnospiraceae bacterium]